MSSNIEENKTLVRRFFAAIEAADLHVFDEIVAENYDDHLAGQSPGRETLKQYFSGLHAAFADLKLNRRDGIPALPDRERATRGALGSRRPLHAYAAAPRLKTFGSNVQLLT